MLVWEPTSRLTLSWDIDANWQPDPTLKTEVEIRFIDDGRGGTRVELEHRLERYGDLSERMHGIFDGEGGWGRLLEAFARSALAVSAG